MNSTIARGAYRRIIRLYPEPFQREFGQEMLSVFDECQAGQTGISHLLSDGLAGAMRQQWCYLVTPAPVRAELYSEIPASPLLASRLAFAVFAVAAFSGIFGPNEPPKVHARATVRIRHEILYYQTSTPKPVCSTPCSKHGA
jgi:hypothetical protein